MFDLKKLLHREPRTRESLEKPPTRRRILTILALVGSALVAAIRWWMTNGQGIAHELLHQANMFQAYWSLASDAEKTTWKMIAITIILFVVLVVFLGHRFVWRAFFPDLKRLDPRRHPGGNSERIGRLYRILPFLDGKITRYRHYYKHGNRWFPLFRFDYVDLDAPARPIMYGVSLIECGRLERDPKGNRFKRTPNAQAFGASPLGTTFRATEVTEDHHRKETIVGSGASTNPEVMRKKARQEPAMNSFMEDRAVALGLSKSSDANEEAP